MNTLDVDILAIHRDIAAGHKRAALERYKGRFLPSDDLISGKLADWRDEVEEGVALTISDVLQEQSHVGGLADLQRIIQLSDEILQIHPHLTSAQIALIEATARTGQLTKAERIYRSIVENDAQSASALPPITSFLGRSAAAPTTHSVPFTGRDEELGALLASWEKTLSGEGQVVLVVGEPGIGKTRLADQFLRRVAIRGGGVWIANCCAATQRLTYSVVNELIQEHAKPASVFLGSLISTSGGESLTHTIERAPDEYRHRLTQALTSHVIERSRQEPLVVLIDDAQWADEYTALLLAYWAYRLRSEKVMLLLTVRTHEAEPPPDWIMSDLGRPVRLHVGRISVAAADDIVSSFEHNHKVFLDRNVRDAVLWQSGGRPFLLLEALASLPNDDSVVRMPPVALTEPAEALLLRRFRNLHAIPSAVMGILAVWGRPVEEQTLRQVCGLSDDEFVHALNALHTRGIAHLHEGLVSFPHELMRETAYRSLLPATRALYHRRAAGELLSAGGPEGLIAQHYAQAGDPERAGAHSIQAASEALESHSYSDYEFYCKLCIKAGSEEHKRQAAAGLARYFVQVGRSSELESVLPLLGSDGDQHRIIESISILERDLASGVKSVVDLLRYAREVATEVSSIEEPAIASLAATLFCVAFDACAGELDYAALTDAPLTGGVTENESRLQVQSVASVWHGVTRDYESGLLRAQLALGSLNEATSPTTRAACLYSHATLLLLAGRVTEARRQFQDALELAQDAGDIRRQLSVYINHGLALMEAGEMEAAQQSLEKAATTTNAHFRIRCYTNLSILHYEEGNSTLAAQAAQAVLSMNSAYQSPSLGSTSCAILGLLALQEGDYDTANTHASSINQQSWSSLDDASYTAMLLCRMLVKAGKGSDALQLLTETINHTKRRDALCTMRLECEQASALALSHPDTAYRLARGVELKAESLGAHRVCSRAREVLLQIRTIARS